MRIKTRQLLLPLVWLATNAWAGQSAPLPDALEVIRSRIQRDLVEQGIPSIAVAVAQRGNIIWEQGFGMADVVSRTPATSDTRYSIASITKPMTATAIMVLVRAGKIDLEAPIDDYLGAAKLNARIGHARDATVRRVLNHTAGLPIHAHFFYSDERRHPPAMDATIQRYANLITPPGERFVYSNLGYGLLGYAISRTARRSYADFMKQEVFLPLGMNSSSVGIEPGKQHLAATRYDLDETAVPFYDFDHPGASAVYASVHDVVRFGMFHLKDHLSGQQAILSDAQIDAMHRPTAGAGSYALGFAIDDHNGYRVISHSGGMVGVATELLLIPEADLVITALANSATALPFEVTQSIAAALLPRWKATPRRVEETPAQFVTPAPLAGRWTGKLSTWRGDTRMTLDFQPDGDVTVTLGDQLTTLVNAAAFAEGRFTGTFLSYIDTSDTARYDHVIDLDLTLRGDRLTGGAKAAAARSGKRRPRVRNALTSWVELTRRPGMPAH